MKKNTTSTAVYLGKRIEKDSLRAEAFGSIDELNSFLGLAKALIKNQKEKKTIETVQKDLLLIGSEIATEPKYKKKLSARINKIQVESLKKKIQELEKKVNLKKQFYLPGESLPAACVDFSRAVARKAERRLISLSKNKLCQNPYLLAYLNHLSNFLFLIARLGLK